MVNLYKLRITVTVECFFKEVISSWDYSYSSSEGVATGIDREFKTSYPGGFITITMVLADYLNESKRAEAIIDRYLDLEGEPRNLEEITVDEIVEEVVEDIQIIL